MISNGGPNLSRRDWAADCSPIASVLRVGEESGLCCPEGFALFLRVFLPNLIRSLTHGEGPGSRFEDGFTSGRRHLVPFQCHLRVRPVVRAP